MIEPKTFYRDFDKLLRKIRHEETRKGFVCSILEEVRNTFGDQLHIDKMWLYEDRGEEFILINKFKDDRRALVKSIPDENEALQLVLKNGSYIYDDHASPQAAKFANIENNIVPAAIIIKGPEHRWLAIFELTSGWLREEVIFSLNAIRTALNYRLFSEAIKTDLEQAEQIQKSLLPQMNPKIPGYEIARKYQPTEVVGGDLYDFIELEENSLGVAVGDASGHGLAAALLVRDCVIGLRMGIEKELKMVHSIKKLNSVIYRSLYSSRFISLFYGEIEKDGHLIYVNAGHPTQFIINGDKIQELKATGLVLGAIPDINIHRSFAQIQPGGVLVLYTDSILERVTYEEEAFGLERLIKLVAEHQDKSAEAILNIIYEAVDSHGHYTKWEDDCTIVIIKRLLK